MRPWALLVHGFVTEEIVHLRIRFVNCYGSGRERAPSNDPRTGPGRRSCSPRWAPTPRSGSPSGSPPIDLTPPQTGLLRAVAAGPGRASRRSPSCWAPRPAGWSPWSTSLAERGLLERRRNPDDRRLHALHVTPAGAQLLRRVREIGRAHDDAIFGALTRPNGPSCARLLARLAEAHALTPGVHPGFRRLGADSAVTGSSDVGLCPSPPQ